MRRTITLVLSTLLLGSVLSGSAMAAKPVKGGDGVNPHIIADGTYLDVDTYREDNGDIRIFWKVAGLGKYGSARLRVRGWVDILVECQYRNDRNYQRDKSIRVNGQDIYSDASGNATGGWYLRPNAVCTRNGTVLSATGTWDGLGVDLYSRVDGSLIESRELTGSFSFTL